MNLKQLEYFVSCAETLNFTRAAERCYITQTGMTQQIRSLENYLGAQLFIRDNHHVKLTKAGALFYEEAKTILRRSESAVRLVRSADAADEGQLDVGFIRGYGHSDLAKLLRMFHTAHPGVKIGLVRDNEHGLLNLLENRELDAAFLVTPFADSLPGLERKLLKTYPLMVAVSVNHPMAERPYLTYADLRNEPFILMQPEGRLHGETEEAMFIYERGGFLPEVAAMEAEPETLLLMVAIGMGISILPEYVLHHMHTREDISIIPLVKEDRTAETLDFEAVWQKDSANAALRQVTDLIGSV